jgi:xanthine dehydrogenase accessory factor
MLSYREIAALEERGEVAVLCVIVSATGSTPRGAGSKMVVYADGRTSGSIGGGEMESYIISEALKVIKESKPRMVKYPKPGSSQGEVSGRQLEVYLEPIYPQATILVVGLGHVGNAVAPLAKFLGFRVVVSDDREGFASPERVPDADIHHTGVLSKLLEEFEVLSKLLEEFALHSHTSVVMTTRNVDVDLKVLPALLETPAAYIGVIGSKKRWETTSKHLLEAGIAEEKINRVVSPMGLSINAETPEEVALSIMAEIVMLRMGGNGGRMVD